MAGIVLKNIKINDRFRIATDRISNQGYYEYKKGSEVKVTYKSGNAINVQLTNNTSARFISVTLQDLSPLALTKEDLKKEMKELDLEKKAIQDKLDWMEETGSEEYDETEVKVWSTLKTLDNKKLTALQKTKAIAELIKNS